uniref:Uncharacterized protein n=1 Tax=Anguilla anguilla TaxID=7936 RepID=A0A0E9W245_ANGAN
MCYNDTVVLFVLDSEADNMITLAYVVPSKIVHTLDIKMKKRMCERNVSPELYFKSI